MLILSALLLQAQIPSNCNVSSELADAYDPDVKGLVIQRMQALSDPDFSFIEIPQEQQDSILEGLAAILHATSLPERDTIFDLYCVHHNFSNPAVYGFIIGVDTESEIAAAWDAGNTLSGNPIIDTLLTEYGFTLTNYISSIGAGVFYTDQLINPFALADSITSSVPEVQYGEPDYLIGGAGRIAYEVNANGDRLYDFTFEWNDCFDGCDNFRTWKFRVTPECAVEYLGAEEGGFFGTEPLPDPVNCMLTSDVDEPVVATPELILYPNPAQHSVFFENAPVRGNWWVFNAVGQPLISGSFDQNRIDVQVLPAGVYCFRYEDGSTRTKTILFVKK
jgi:hypothetical protein